MKVIKVTYTRNPGLNASTGIIDAGQNCTANFYQGTLTLMGPEIKYVINDVKTCSFEEVER